MINLRLKTKEMLTVSRDYQLICELKNICADGQNFYSLAAGKTESSELRMLFHNIARERADIVKDINQSFGELRDKQMGESELVRTMRAIYKIVQKMCTSPIDVDRLSDLELTEMRSLEIFKIQVRKMANRVVASYIAGHLASMQLTQDKMKRLRIGQENSLF